MTGGASRPAPPGSRWWATRGRSGRASTMVEVKALIDPEMLVEIEVDALLPNSGSGAKKE